MELNFLNEFVTPMIVGVCLCIGYILKNFIETDKINKYIPLIMGCIGVILNIWICGEFTPTVLLGGLFSGLASTGLYEAFRNLINKSSEKEEE